MSIHMEPDYINRRELLGEISKHFETIGANAERLVSRFPSADFSEVIRGKCEYCKDNLFDGYALEMVAGRYPKVISRMGAVHTVSSNQKLFSYCPNCGRKLNGANK